MKNKIYISVMLIFACLIQATAQSPVVAPAQKKPVMLIGGTIHTGTGDVIENGTIVFTGGKITSVGKSADIKVDKVGYEVIDVTGKQIYPGLIFPNTSLGLIEIGSGVDVATDNREIGDLNPNVRAIAAYNTDSHVIPVIRSNGILLAQIVPTGTLLPGTSSVVQLDAWNWEDAAYKIDNGIQLGWPRKSSIRWKERRWRYCHMLQRRALTLMIKMLNCLKRSLLMQSLMLQLKNLKMLISGLKSLKRSFRWDQRSCLSVPLNQKV